MRLNNLRVSLLFQLLFHLIVFPFLFILQCVMRVLMYYFANNSIEMVKLSKIGKFPLKMQNAIGPSCWKCVFSLYPILIFFILHLFFVNVHDDQKSLRRCIIWGKKWQFIINKIDLKNLIFIFALFIKFGIR